MDLAKRDLIMQQLQSEIKKTTLPFHIDRLSPGLAEAPQWNRDLNLK